MDTKITIDVADCEVKFDDNEIIFFWFDEYCPLVYKLRDQLEITINSNGFAHVLPIDTNPISYDIMTKRNSRTYIQITDGVKFFFNSDRIDRDAPANFSPRHKLMMYYKARYKVEQFGLIFRSIIHLLTFLDIGVNNPINSRYFNAVIQHHEEEDKKLRRVNSF